VNQIRGKIPFDPNIILYQGGECRMKKILFATSEAVPFIKTIIMCNITIKNTMILYSAYYKYKLILSDNLWRII
jgi:hypothetical protein